MIRKIMPSGRLTRGAHHTRAMLTRVAPAKLRRGPLEAAVAAGLLLSHRLSTDDKR